MVNVKICIFLLTDVFTTVSTNSLCICSECDSGNSHSLYLLLSGILPTIVISTIISIIVTAVFFRLFCEIKCKRKTKTISSPQHSSHFHDKSFQDIPGPLYEEVDLTDKEFHLKCSHNVAYQSTSNK